MPRGEASEGQAGLVSIGLGTFNNFARGSSLERALDSLLAQTYKNFEIILSDNASDDGTREVCERYANQDKRVRYIRQQKNIGGPMNLDFVLHQARGEYFMWAADDDSWSPRFIERCLARLRQEPLSSMAFGRFAFLYSDGHKSRFEAKDYFPSARDLYGRLRQFILFYLWHGKATLICGLWRRSAVASDRIRHWLDDVGFIFRALSRGHFVFVDEELFFKGVLPGRESKSRDPVTVKRIFRSLSDRVGLLRIYGENITHIFRLDGLSLHEKAALIGTVLFVVVRNFVSRKV